MAARKSGTCGKPVASCSHNPDNILSSLDVTTASDCCTLCSTNRECKSYTAWTDNKTTPPIMKCNLFSTTVVASAARVDASVCGKLSRDATGA